METKLWIALLKDEPNLSVARLFIDIQMTYEPLIRSQTEKGHSIFQIPTVPFSHTLPPVEAALHGKCPLTTIPNHEYGVQSFIGTHFGTLFNYKP